MQIQVLVMEGTRFIILSNILNPSLVVSNLTFFYSGAYVFSNIIVNIDVSRSFGAVSIRIGIEGRQEKFDITEGKMSLMLLEGHNLFQDHNLVKN